MLLLRGLRVLLTRHRDLRAVGLQHRADFHQRVADSKRERENGCVSAAPQEQATQHRGDDEQDRQAADDGREGAQRVGRGREGG